MNVRCCLMLLVVAAAIGLSLPISDLGAPFDQGASASSVTGGCTANSRGRKMENVRPTAGETVQNLLSNAPGQVAPLPRRASALTNAQTMAGKRHVVATSRIAARRTTPPPKNVER